MLNAAATPRDDEFEKIAKDYIEKYFALILSRRRSSVTIDLMLL